MSGQKTLPDTHNAIFSQEEGSGALQPDSQDGQTTDLFGQAPAHASRSRSRVKEPEPMIQGTYGRTFFDLSARVNQRSLWVSRLQARLGMVGSTEFDLTWKLKDTPAMGSIFRLAPSTRRTSDSDCIGSQQTWPTPKASDGEGGRTTKTKGGGNSHLPIHAREAATWPTPTAVNRVRDEETLAKCAEFRLRNAGQKTVPLYLGEVAADTHAATWPTPTTRDGKDGQFTPNVPENALLGRTVWNGDEAQTEKRGALNPEFVFWLMGCPEEWVCSALAATQSWRPSRRK